ncbi:cupin domain-containing protein [Halorientalis halophila]|uniref:cupin domain-containing protein n=1 Tax=Halorientalis halophila TaxID=3108499 RepID=UPI00300BA4ED
MEYAVVDTEEIPKVDLDEALNGMFDPDVRRVQAELGTENLVASLWYFEEGEEMVHHEHEDQEELYYVLDGEFEVKLGDAGETETVVAEEGTFFAAGPGVGHGHVCTSADGGVVLAVGSPNVTDINPETYTPVDEA